MERKRKKFENSRVSIVNLFSEIITYLPQIIDYFLFSKNKNKELEKAISKMYSLETKINLLEKEIENLKAYNEEISKRIRFILNLFIVILILIILILFLITLKFLLK